MALRDKRSSRFRVANETLRAVWTSGMIRDDKLAEFMVLSKQIFNRILNPEVVSNDTKEKTEVHRQIRR